MPQRIIGGAALGCTLLACAWTLCANLAGIHARQAGADQVRETPPPSVAASANATSVIVKTYAPPAAATNAYAKLAAALNAYARRATASGSEIAFFDSRWLGSPPGSLVKSAALRADGQSTSQSTIQKTQAAASTPLSRDQAAQNAPLPSLQLRMPQTRTASLRDDAHASRAAADTTADRPSIFEKLFGKPSPLTLAYAAPDDGGLSDGQGVTSGRYDRWTAVYDISAHTVYLPDGSKLEAHSGLGSRLDDPRHAAERMRGPTPPNVYDLKLREAPFHGVQALRLIPVDDEKVFGRSGLLAHTYMLGPNGQSFGCVSFRNYNAFLQAYLKHEIKRLVVVSRLD